MADASSFVDCSGHQFNPDAVVSKGSDGKYPTLTDAVKAIPSSFKGRFIIYVKKGVYEENVTISRSEVTLIGDGKDNTIICSRLSQRGNNISIQDSGAVIVLADNFIAKCITFENASGIDKGQAVALRSEGDKSAFYLCGFKGYQDTLYVNKGQQFFRECDVYGTVDFIFGDAFMVLQKCNIYFRAGQGVMTAQGRRDRLANTAISVDRCTITVDPSLPKIPQITKCFLGRPWKEYARAVVMKSCIGNVIDPAGYHDWEGRSHAMTAEYIEYANYGPGSVSSVCPGPSCPRVKWPGFKALKPEEGEQVKPFSVGVFIEGSQWLPSTGVPFDLDV